MTTGPGFDIEGTLGPNVVHFAQLLRLAGLPVGTDAIQNALCALLAGNIDSRQDLRELMAVCLVSRRDQRALFDDAFELFWDRLALSLVGSPVVPLSMPTEAAPSNQRLQDALGKLMGPSPGQRRQVVEENIDEAPSDADAFRRMDFQSMNLQEWAAAKRFIAELPAWLRPRPTRRSKAAAGGQRWDWRRTIKRMASGQGDPRPVLRTPRTQPPPIVIVADISGSMSRYSRTLLHLSHALSRSDAPLESFVFGTRLSRITKLLEGKDPDVAVARITKAVNDWSGGTRITEALRTFNRHWARRVLAQNATVLLVTDGLERGGTDGLAFEMERLRKSCRRLIWLNPLLRYTAFEAKAAGIKAMLPWVDQFLPVHNLASLEALMKALSGRSGDLRNQFT